MTTSLEKSISNHPVRALPRLLKPAIALIVILLLSISFIAHAADYSPTMESDQSNGASWNYLQVRPVGNSVPNCFMAFASDGYGGTTFPNTYRIESANSFCTGSSLSVSGNWYLFAVPSVDDCTVANIGATPANTPLDVSALADGTVVCGVSQLRDADGPIWAAVTVDASDTTYYGLTLANLTLFPQTGSCFATPDDGATVYSSADSQAVRDAVAAAGAGGTVKIAGACTGVSTVNTHDQVLYVDTTLTIEGGYSSIEWTTSDPVARPTMLDADAAGRVIYVAATGDLTASNLTLTNGQPLNTDPNGSGVFNDGGVVDLDRIWITGMNTANSNDGNAIYNSGGTVTLVNSTVSDNVQTGSGVGLLRNSSGTFTVERSLITNNNMGPSGYAAIWNAGTFTLSNSTVSNNTGYTAQGGAVEHWGGTTNILNSTIINNAAASAGGGVVLTSGTVNMGGTIVAGNQANLGDEIAVLGGTFNSQGYNLLGDSSKTTAEALYGTTPAGTDITATSDGTNPTALASILETTLADNGGPTQTYALVSGSPAIDMIPNGSGGCGTTLTVDQRSYDRPSPTGGACDAGAYEFTPVCFATADDGTTVYSSVNSQAVRDAVAVANDGDTVKVAGTCAGVSGGQLTSIDTPITLQGGYTTTNWTTSDPTTNPTILDAQNGGNVLATGSPLTVSNLQLQNGSAGSGGAIISTAAVTVTNSTLISNTVTGRGGAIYSIGALNISDSTIENNRATGTIDTTGGSAIWGTSSLVMDNTDVLSNYAGMDYTIRVVGPVTVTNSLFQNNLVEDDGGALYSLSGALYLADSDFIENSSNGSKGSTGNCIVAIQAGGEVTGTQFLRNTLVNGTGTLCAVGTGDVAITNSQFLSNTVSASGGGLYAATAGGTVTVSNSDFISNTATNGGGGIYAIGVTSGVTVTNSNFNHNTASFGGGIENSGTLNVINSTFNDNSATIESGSAILNMGDASVLQVENSTFMHNTAVSGRGTIESSGATAVVTNSTFYSNTAYSAAGFSANLGTSTLVNNTFSDNANTNTNPYTVYGGSGTLNLYNNLIANTVIGSDCGGTLATNTANLIEDGTCSPSVSGDPLLGAMVYTGLGGTGVLPLQAESPAIDAGDDASAPAADQRGVARPQGSQSDIGAYEADAGEADLAVSQSIELNFTQPTFTIVVDNNGPDAAPGAVVSVTFPVEITGVAWTCTSSGGAVCPNASGSGNTINETVATFPAGGQLTYTVDTTYFGPPVSNTAEVVPPAGIVDPDMTNNESTQVTSYVIILPVVYKDASFTP